MRARLLSDKRPSFFLLPRHSQHTSKGIIFRTRLVTEVPVEDQKLVQEPKLGVGDGIVGMLNIFVDPKGTAKRVPAPLSWLWPLITACAIYVVFGYLMLPYTMALIDLRLNQQNTPPEQAERARALVHMVYQFLPVVTPIFVVLIGLLIAWLVTAMGSVAGLRAKFRD